VTSLADRIRGIVRTSAPGLPDPCGLPGPSQRPALPGRSALPDLERALGGEWCDGCFVVDRRSEPSARYGKDAVGTVARRLDEASAEAVLFTGHPGVRHRVECAKASDTRSPFVFFDLETTGLSGGAGTQAFLIGCGWFEGDGAFATRQFMLTRYADERPLLETVSAQLARAGALVSFNGKSFDAPLLETRFLFHRLEWIGGCLPHVDVLHPARQFWKRRGMEESSCSLIALEREVLGVRRAGDVPGFEIPGRYFQFVRSGDAGPLAAVLEHNRRDLLTLAALTARLFHLARAGADAARDAREAVALGRVYARAGDDDRACAAYRHALERCRSPRGAFDSMRIDALRRLALAGRRARRFEDAAWCWRELLEVRGCPPPVLREATEALAIHHEHRLRDLASARLFALRTLESVEEGMRSGWTEAVQHRLTRIDRKMARSQSEVGSLELLPDF
jgi:uncharacterized protein YprB with RNaseH-like and TPR domain